MGQEHGLKSVWSRDSFFWFIACLTIYILLLVIFSTLILVNHWLENNSPFVGVIIGAFFPIVSFLYYYRNYLKVQVPETPRSNIFSWVIPALITQVVVMIAFMIVLGYGIKEDIQYDRSFFTSGLHYGNIFKEFQKDERVMLNKRRLKYEDITSVLNYYQSLVLTETNEICPPKTDQDESLAYCMKKYAKLYNAIDAIPFYMAITFGFLGALIFCLSDLVKRFNMVDLYPKNFVFYSIRFLVAASLCATLANFFLEGFPVIMAMPIFFLIGYFPERAIKYLDQKMTDYLGFKTYKPISLSLVQGMSVEKAFRLREIGIEDVQHLAVTNVNYLKKNLPYNRNMLCDWINQSLLILYFSKQIEALRDAGVRTILDLQNCLLASPENEIKECAKKVGISAIKLQHVKKILETHSMRARIDDLKICLEKACEVEPEKIS